MGLVVVFITQRLRDAEAGRLDFLFLPSFLNISFYVLLLCVPASPREKIISPSFLVMVLTLGMVESSIGLCVFYRFMCCFGLC